MKQSISRITVTKNILQMVTLMSLMTLTIGRSIENFMQSVESKNNRKNKISDIENRGWYPNQASNSEVRDPRLSELEWSHYTVREPNGPGTFAFGYDNAVDSAGNEHYRSEERFDNGTVIGEYGHTDHAIKRIVRVSYIADARGYRAKTQILPMGDINSRNTISSDRI